MRTTSGSTTIRRRTILGSRFEIVRPVGTGPLGTVYEALDRELGMLIALKIIHPHISADGGVLERVRSTIQKTRQLSHPNIVRVYDLELLDEKWNTISIELVQGCNLHELLRRDFRSGVPFRNAIILLRKILNALAFAHERGVPHLGLRPENILVTMEGEIKISDFHLSQTFTDTLGLTRTGETSGSPLYMAPEQFLNEPLGPPTDLYSAGLILYELLTGAPPFNDEGFLRLADHHIKDDIPPPSRRVSSLPEWVDALVSALCTKDPCARPDALSALESIEREAERTQDLTSSSEIKPRRAAAAPPDQRNHVIILCVCAFTSIAITIWTFAQPACRQRLAIATLGIERIFGLRLVPVRAILGIQQLDLNNPESLLQMLVDLKHEPDWRTNAYSMALPLLHLVGMQDAAGRRAIHYAAIANRLDFIAHLHALGYPIHIRDIEGKTALHYAVEHRSIDTANQLLGLGARPDTASTDGTTPIMIAVRQRNLDMLKSLLSDATVYNLAHTTKDGPSPLHLAAELGDEQIVQQLLIHGALVDERDARGRTPLVTAILGPPSNERMKAIKHLLAFGGERLLRARDDDGRTALEHAIEVGHSETIAVLAAAASRGPVTDVSS